MAMMLPGGKAAATKNRGHGGNAAIAVNLDTGHHVDSKGHTHKTHPGNKARVGPDTMIFAQGHAALPFHHHAARKTPVHKRMMGKGNPHPHALMDKMMAALPPDGAPPMLPGGAMGASPMPTGPMPPAPGGLPGGALPPALRGV
jgi:hypothetical protein